MNEFNEFYHEIYVRTIKSNLLTNSLSPSGRFKLYNFLTLIIRLHVRKNNMSQIKTS